MSDYSAYAERQIDLIEDDALYNAVLDTCEVILHRPGLAQSLSGVITSEQGLRLTLQVEGHPEWLVFWSSAGPRIEAVF